MDHIGIGREPALSKRSAPKGRGAFLAWFVYILRCSDGSYYVGHTEDVAARVKRHQDGRGAAWTAARRPVSLVFEEEHLSEAAAVARERQIKRWSRQKKEALFAGKLTSLKKLSRCRGLHGQSDA
jgi:predicted GIY-YIG superfamily endonuclease